MKVWDTFGARDIPDDIANELQSLGDRDTDGAKERDEKRACKTYTKARGRDY